MDFFSYGPLDRASRRHAALILIVNFYEKDITMCACLQTRIGIAQRLQTLKLFLRAASR